MGLFWHYFCPNHKFLLLKSDYLLPYMKKIEKMSDAIPFKVWPTTRRGLRTHSITRPSVKRSFPRIFLILAVPGFHSNSSDDQRVFLHKEIYFPETSNVWLQTDKSWDCPNKKSNDWMKLRKVGIRSFGMASVAVRRWMSVWGRGRYFSPSLAVRTFSRVSQSGATRTLRDLLRELVARSCQKCHSRCFWTILITICGLFPPCGFLLESCDCLTY